MTNIMIRVILVGVGVFILLPDVEHFFCSPYML